jgi:hypothetical protein
VASAVSIHHPRKTCLGSELERVRLEHRARRLRLMIGLLGERARMCRRAAPAPPALQRAIQDFSAELSQVRRRLHGAQGD